MLPLLHISAIKPRRCPSLWEAKCQFRGPSEHALIWWWNHKGGISGLKESSRMTPLYQIPRILPLPIINSSDAIEGSFVGAEKQIKQQQYQIPKTKELWVIPSTARIIFRRSTWKAQFCRKLESCDGTASLKKKKDSEVKQQPYHVDRSKRDEFL